MNPLPNARYGVQDGSESFATSPVEHGIPNVSTLCVFLEPPKPTSKITLCPTKPAEAVRTSRLKEAL